jgi:hypothetical protein
MEFKTVTRKELKNMKASDFKDGDCVQCGKYFIVIKYRSDSGWEYDIPSLCSYVEVNGRIIDCTPGIERPYYIDDFLSR